jgi:hypothetical protein
MRIVVVGIFIILAVWVLAAGIINKRRISWLMVFVFLVPAGALGYFEYKWQQEQDEISISVVQAISGVKESKIDCQRLTFAFVDVWASEKTTDSGKTHAGLKYSVCSQILGYYRSDPKKNPTLDEVKAFQLLSAESVRIAGKTNKEDEIQCLGIRNIKLVVQGLGGSSSQANYAYNLYKQEVFSKDNELQKFNC